jgi:hypothetical protein
MEIRGQQENVTKHELTINILWIRNEKSFTVCRWSYVIYGHR